ncbi:serine protease family S28 [Thraustotheca clavata]|uniref:Secreted protein n=1 Tax=Thraustotheca clavata TaxID=74557 RepID=A0A0A7CLU9_9STRA|nr:secreted protein [Thraustotheca clavata]OQS07366.1 serine protease family S28 [Thraustotheca clavata]
MKMLGRSMLLLWSFSISWIVIDASRHRWDDFRGHQHHIQYDPDNNWIPAVVEYKYTQAILDHFAPVSDRKYWNQRYFVNDEFWAGVGFPVFLYIGGEGPLSPTALSDKNYIHVLAKKHRALMVAVEHRFYGASYPTPDMSIENLRYLSSQQALYDLARIHSYLTGVYGLGQSKWVAFGGSYPGALAAWFKLKYPSLVAGSVASSAPLWAKENFPEYMEVVGNGLRYFGGGECYRAVEKAMIELHALLDDGREGRQKLTELFNPCSPMKNEFDDSVFETSIMSFFQGVSQYNNIYGGPTLTDVCNTFSKGNDSLAQLVDFVNQVKTKPCIDSNFQGTENGTIEVLSDVKFDGKKAGRQWFYQTCNEFGYFQTAESANSPFWPLKTQSLQNVGLEICKRVYKIDTHPDTASTNVNYGSLDITVNNVVFPSGTIDPWHALAVQNSTHMNLPSSHPIYIDGTAHCADMHAPNATKDTGHMIWARQQIATAVAFFIGPVLSTE